MSSTDTPAPEPKPETATSQSPSVFNNYSELYAQNIKPNTPEQHYGEYNVKLSGGYFKVCRRDSAYTSEPVPNHDWKVHIGISTTNVDNFNRAWEIFSDVIQKYGLMEMKVIALAPDGKITNESGARKQITIYCQQENPENLITCLMELEQRLFNNKNGEPITPDTRAVPGDCKEISSFMSFRYERFSFDQPGAFPNSSILGAPAGYIHDLHLHFANGFYPIMKELKITNFSDDVSKYRFDQFFVRELRNRADINNMFKVREKDGKKYKMVDDARFRQEIFSILEKYLVLSNQGQIPTYNLQGSDDIFGLENLKAKLTTPSAEKTATLEATTASSSVQAPPPQASSPVEQAPTAAADKVPAALTASHSQPLPLANDPHSNSGNHPSLSGQFQHAQAGAERQSQNVVDSDPHYLTISRDSLPKSQPANPQPPIEVETGPTSDKDPPEKSSDSSDRERPTN